MLLYLFDAFGVVSLKFLRQSNSVVADMTLEYERFAYEVPHTRKSVRTQLNLVNKRPTACGKSVHSGKDLEESLSHV